MKFVVRLSFAYLLVAALHADATDIPTPEWCAAKFPVTAAGRILDTSEVTNMAHAASTMVDLDNDGLPDLVIGSIAGEFRFHRNVGSATSPAYAEGRPLLVVDGTPAKVMNWCCVAAAPSFIDLDNDGIRDLVTTSYGGPIYVFKGTNDPLVFRQPSQLLTMHGVTLVAHAETFLEPDGPMQSYAPHAAWTKWNDDEYPDLVLGTDGGELLVFRNRGVASDYMPYPMPSFAVMKVRPDTPQNEILIDGKRALPPGERHSAPTVADWDGDGLWDLIVGTKSGNVYFLRNTGRQGAPIFGSCELLVAGGTGVQLLEDGEQLGFGIRTQVHVADYNGDGKPDLLVGCFSAAMIPRDVLSPAQREQMMSLWSRLEAIDREVGNTHRELVSAFAPYYSSESNKQRYEQANALLKEIRRYLRTYSVKLGRHDVEYDLHFHGNVWVFLRK